MKLKFLLLFSTLLFAACSQSYTPESPDSPSSDSSSQPPAIQTDSSSPDSSDPEVSSEEVLQDELATQTGGRYMNYTPQLAMDLVEQGKPHVIFFHANWCSWCRRMEQDLLTQSDTFSEDAVILKANFDKETELREKFGVTVKDTYVFVDAAGENVVKSGATLDDLRNFFVTSSVSEEAVENPTGVAFYGAYDSEIVETFVGKKPYALFFHATWCPTCKKVDEELVAAIDEMPSSVAVFKTDFDTELDLRKENGVTMQHTLVAFDANGVMTEVIPGFTLDDVKRVFTQ